MRGRRSSVNDPETVREEYESEERFLARRLGTWAELVGPLVEDETVEAVFEGMPSRVLDVGCGTGDVTERLLRDAGVTVVALDLSLRMARLTRVLGLNAVQATIEALPVGDGEFDCVLANRVLYHLPDLDGGLAEIARVLRPGGRLVAVTYSQRHLEELFDIVGYSPIASTFSAETVAQDLGSRFVAVERRSITGRATFPDVRSIAGYLAAYGAFSEMDLASRLGAARAPLAAHYRHAVFVACKPA